MYKVLIIEVPVVTCYLEEWHYIHQNESHCKSIVGISLFGRHTGSYKRQL